MAEDKYTAIIVGAGPAGSTAAYLLAREGYEVLLIERGAAPGSKNMFGGRMYSYALQRIIPDFWEEAPVERAVVREVIATLTEESSVSFSCQDESWGKAPYHSFTLLRADFDAWLAAKAEEAGALLAPGIRVDDLLLEDGKVVGVRAGEDELRADVVIAADGVNSLLAQKAGLRPELPAIHVGIGVKQIIELSPEKIEERFQLTGNQGAACLLVGAVSRGMPGGGFLYTNKNSISLGLVVNVGGIENQQCSVRDLLEDFKAHPFIVPLIKDGRATEYSAHLVPEAGWEMRPQLFGPGILVAGDAAGFVLNLGYQVRGMDLAIASGQAAAETVQLAVAKQDFSKAGLSPYLDKLNALSVLPDLESYRLAPKFLENPLLYQRYPKLLAGIATKLFTVQGEPAQPLAKKMLSQIKENNFSLLQLAREAWKGGRSL